MSDLNDGFGDEKTVNETIAEVEGWAKHYASTMVNRNDEIYDELVQAARIRAWKTIERKEKVNQSYLITAMRWEMLSRIKSHTESQKKAQPVDYDDLDPALLEAPDMLSKVDWAYHHGEILEVINSFEPEWREYIYRRFWQGQPDNMIAHEMNVWPSRIHRLWHNKIRPELQKELAHLNA